MKLAIMQPYFFPSIYYWQLIYHVDKFLILDDVNFIKNKFIHRNFVPHTGSLIQITIKCKNKSSFKKINEIEILKKQEFFNQLNFLYKRFKNFDEIMNILNDSFANEKNLSKFLSKLIISISKYLDFKTEFINSSELGLFQDLKGENRIIKFCEYFNAIEYSNLIGGIKIYDKNNFKRKNIELKFINKSSYSEKISILDHLMKRKKSDLIQDIKKIELI
tara:strand:+ start:212 stop:868 length:657 start_codon:yes stop_codon:yes gene_type:complete